MSIGNFELTKMNRLISRKLCNNLSDLPAAIDMLEKNLRHYETSMGAEFPQEFKIPMLMQILPEAHRKDLQMKYETGQNEFRIICDNISAFATEHWDCTRYLSPSCNML